MSCILEGLIERQGVAETALFCFLPRYLNSSATTRRCLCAGYRGPARSSVPGKDDYPWLTHVTKSDVNSHRVGRAKTLSVASAWVGFIVNKRYCAYRVGGKSGKMHRLDPEFVDDAIKVHRQLLARGVIPTSAFHSFIAALLLAIASESKRNAGALW